LRSFSWKQSGCRYQRLEEVCVLRDEAFYKPDIETENAKYRLFSRQLRVADYAATILWTLIDNGEVYFQRPKQDGRYVDAWMEIRRFFADLRKER
jgi:hypothetical protein